MDWIQKIHVTILCFFFFPLFIYDMSVGLLHNFEVKIEEVEEEETTPPG